MYTTTTLKALHSFSNQATEVTAALGADLTSVFILSFDNVQNHTLHKPTIGHHSSTNLGIATTAYEIETRTPEVFSILEKRKLQLVHNQSTLTVGIMLADLDQTHQDLVFALQWLQICVITV